MKNKNAVLVLLLFISASAAAQSVGFSYQAVAVDASKAETLGRDSRGEILANQEIALRFSLHEGSEDGPVRYQEKHDTATDIFGIFRLTIGRGYDVIGTALTELKWGIVPYFLEIEIDLGNGYQHLGYEELLGSPYALNQKKQTLSLDDNLLAISDGNSVVLNDNSAMNELITDFELNGSRLSVTDAGGTHTVDLSSLMPVTTPMLTTNGTPGNISLNNGSPVSINVNDADASPANEIQDLQLNGHQLKITNNANATTIDLSAYANNSALAEAEVDQMVANNGYLLTESQNIMTTGTPGNISIDGGATLNLNVNDADANPTNEIQDLSLDPSTNMLSITNNPSSSGVDLSTYRNVFGRTNGVISNENGDYASDDFVFGSPTLEYEGNDHHRSRMLFNKNQAAFRAGLDEGIPWSNSQLGFASAAFGRGTTASNDYSAAFGIGTVASGYGSVAFGHQTTASGGMALAAGSFNNASGSWSAALGNSSQAPGNASLSGGYGTISTSFSEIALGTFNSTYTAGSVDVFVPTDRLFVVGNGTGFSSSTRSDALVMLKNGNTRLHGQLTIDADNVNGTGEQYTLPGQDGAANQVLVTDGNGNVSWGAVAANIVSETDVDNFVSDNGYLTAEVDGSVTNEIQDLQLDPTTHTLSVTNNTAATGIDLSSYSNVFERTNGVVSNENGDYATDDFVFGGPDLNSAGIKFFFDKSKRAFRGGQATGAGWADANIGNVSFGFGYDAIASGDGSWAFGTAALATNVGSMAWGSLNQSHGLASVAAGYQNTVNGNWSAALGRLSTIEAPADRAVALGGNNIVSGWGGVGIGNRLQSRSTSEIVLGYGNTNVPGSNNQWILTDRLFVIGNGTPVFSDLTLPPNQSDALVMLKNGNTRLHGQLTIDADNVSGPGESYTLPGQDGAANQVLTTDGNGSVSWANASGAVSEADVDNFVSNNGYLTAEVDGSVTNEIQDLQLDPATHTLSVTNNASATPIDLSSYLNVFERTNGVISNENGDYATDDFVFGSPQLDDDGVDVHRMRMFFDKSKGAFRAGNVTSTQWNQSNTADFSAAFGNNTTASGNGSFATGQFSTSSGLTSFASGYQTSATGNFTFAHGAQATSSGSGSIAIGTAVNATNTSSIAIGHNASATGSHGIAIGESVNATASNATAIGWSLNASGANAVALGVSSSATGNSSTVFGSNNVASGIFSVAHGYNSSASGHSSFASGYFTNASSFGETTIGVNSTVDPPLSSTNWLSNDRLFKIGNGAHGASRSDALVMLKNGNTRLHGQLTIDADNINGAGESYTLPGQDGAANQVLTTDGNGNVSWANASGAVTEADVDNFVSNNGYLTAEVDGSVTNEIQDLQLDPATHMLSVTNNASATAIDLSSYLNVFERTNGVISNENGDYATDDFVFGSPTTHYTVGQSARFFFDKSKGAFRAGVSWNNSWDDANVGQYSVAFGLNSRASGINSVALGSTASATGTDAFAFDGSATNANAIALGISFASGERSVAVGYGAMAGGESSVAFQNGQASGDYSFAFGDLAMANGNYSFAFGEYSRAQLAGSVAIGLDARAEGLASFALGSNLNAHSLSEFVIGFNNTSYVPNSASSYHANDRLFVIGNGQFSAAPTDALVMLKNGNTRLHGLLTIDADNVNGAGLSYTLPGQRGSNGQALVTDGAGNVGWVNVDANSTNEIQDLSLNTNTHVLNITNNASATSINLAPYVNVFETTNNVTSNENGAYATDDFVFGSPQLNGDGDVNHNTRMMFDKSTGAFRAGMATGDLWNEANRGPNSAAFGENVVARGHYSFAAGLDNLAHATSTVAIGTNVSAEAYNSIAIGRNVITTGEHAMAFGFYSAARSFGETVMGLHATDVLPLSTQSFHADDRLFTIGNGQAGTPSDALTILKNGNTTLHGELTIDANNGAATDGYRLPGQDGTAGQFLVTNGMSQVSWSNTIMDLTVTGTFTQTSDARYKKNLSPLRGSLKKLSLVKGYNYNWNKTFDKDTASLQTGVIAQELEKVFPELVKTEADGYKSVNYIGLIPHLIEAIKDIEQKNKELQSSAVQLREQDKKIKSLEARLIALEKILTEK